MPNTVLSIVIYIDPSLIRRRIKAMFGQKCKNILEINLSTWGRYKKLCQSLLLNLVLILILYIFLSYALIFKPLIQKLWLCKLGSWKVAKGLTLVALLQQCLPLMLIVLINSSTVSYKISLAGLPVPVFPVLGGIDRLFAVQILAEQCEHSPWLESSFQVRGDWSGPLEKPHEWV